MEPRTFPCMASMDICPLVLMYCVRKCQGVRENPVAYSPLSLILSHILRFASRCSSIISHVRRQAFCWPCVSATSPSIPPCPRSKSRKLHWFWGIFVAFYWGEGRIDSHANYTVRYLGHPPLFYAACLGHPLDGGSVIRFDLPEIARPLVVIIRFGPPCSRTPRLLCWVLHTISYARCCSFTGS